MPKILEGHKKVGQKFIPPLLQISSLHETSYVHQLLPEIIWIALITTQTDNVNALVKAELLFDTIRKYTKQGDFINYGIISNTAKLSNENKNAIASDLQSHSEGHELIRLLEPLTELYEACPLNFIKADQPSTSETDTLLDIIKSSVESHIDRNSTNGLIAQSILAHLRQHSGGANYPTEIQPPNFRKFAICPTENVDASLPPRIRTHVNMELAAGGVPQTDEWARSFWNTNLKLSECKQHD